jgi:phage antirepressor YoqD-like protein
MTYSQEQAKHRVSIKRQLRQLGYTNFNNEDTTAVLEAKLAEAKADTQEKPAMSATEILRKINEIYVPIKVEMQKYVNNLTLQEVTSLCKLHDIHHKELVHFLAKRKAIPLYKQAGLV